MLHVFRFTASENAGLSFTFVYVIQEHLISAPQCRDGAFEKVAPRSESIYSRKLCLLVSINCSADAENRADA